MTVVTASFSCCRQSQSLCRQRGITPCCAHSLSAKGGQLAHLQGAKCVFRGTRPRKTRLVRRRQQACAGVQDPSAAATPPQDDTPSGIGLCAARYHLHLAVPGKCCRHTLIFAFFDRCGNCGLAFSATGSARPQFPRRGRQGRATARVARTEDAPIGLRPLSPQGGSKSGEEGTCGRTARENGGRPQGSPLQENGGPHPAPRATCPPCGARGRLWMTPRGRKPAGCFLTAGS